MLHTFPSITGTMPSQILLVLCSGIDFRGLSVPRGNGADFRCPRGNSPVAFYILQWTAFSKCGVIPSCWKQACLLSRADHVNRATAWPWDDVCPGANWAWWCDTRLSLGQIPCCAFSATWGFSCTQYTALNITHFKLKHASSLNII